MTMKTDCFFKFSGTSGTSSNFSPLGLMYHGQGIFKILYNCCERTWLVKPLRLTMSHTLSELTKSSHASISPKATAMLSPTKQGLLIYEMTEGWRFGACIRLLVAALCVLIAWSYVQACRTKPPPVPRKFSLTQSRHFYKEQHNLQDYFRDERLHNVELKRRLLRQDAVRSGLPIRTKGPAARMCTRCEIVQPARTYHCFQCDRCIIRMEEHSRFFGQCIHYGNTKYATLTAIYICGLTLVFGHAFAHFLSKVIFGNDRNVLHCALVAILTVISWKVFVSNVRFIKRAVTNYKKNSTVREQQEQRRKMNMLDKIYKKKINYDIGDQWKNVEEAIGSPWCWPFPVNGFIREKDWTSFVKYSENEGTLYPFLYDPTEITLEDYAPVTRHDFISNLRRISVCFFQLERICKADEDWREALLQLCDQRTPSTQTSMSERTRVAECLKAAKIRPPARPYPHFPALPRPRPTHATPAAGTASAPKRKRVFITRIERYSHQRRTPLFSASIRRFFIPQIDLPDFDKTPSASPEGTPPASPAKPSAARQAKPSSESQARPPPESQARPSSAPQTEQTSA